MLTSIFQSAQIREFELLAAERFATTSTMLMQRAGNAAFNFLMQRWPQAKNIAVICGSGNNGGDGYVLALLAAQSGLRVRVFQVGNHDNLKTEAKEALLACQKAKLMLEPLVPDTSLESTDLIVDALLGIGIHTILRDETVAAINLMQRAHKPILSLDVPSGIDADSGQILGAAVRASATITFIGLKLGLLTGAGIAHTGELILNDLQLPNEIYSHVVPVAEKIVLSAFATYLQPRTRDWHKGLSGHVLVIGGDDGYSGAPRMAALAALRVGAGLVSVATRPENATTMNATHPEIMCHGIQRADDLEPLLNKADVVVLGPGLGQSTWAKMVWAHVVSKELPMVVDADGLNLLAQTTMTHDNWVLTPHPGEAARLINDVPQIIQQDRLSAARHIVKRYGGTCVLKGAGTIVLTLKALPGVCDLGNPGMATAGMGDVLSGVIGGLVAQGIPLGDAAKLGVCLHAMAGDLAAKEGERGLIATDLLPYIRQLSNYSDQL